jgi:hypothetical protein
MKAISKCLGLLLISATLASCGGGGGGSGSHNAFDPPSSGTLDLQATTQQLPLNRNGVSPFFGSPFMSEVTVTWRRANGDLITGTDVNVAINPTAVAGFSMLDDPTTDWTGQTTTPPTAKGNEFLTILGSGPVHVTAGHATIFVHSFNTAGTATLTITATDPSTANSTITKSLTFTVIASTPSLPATIELLSNPNHVYVAGSGGNNSSQVSVHVVDGEGQNVPNPTSGNTAFNNVQLEVLGQAGSGSLTAIDAGGTSHTGASIKTRTLQGVAGASFTGDTVQGSVQIRVTADAADNNVDNGITTPVTAIVSVVVSDGKLFSLVLTSPDQGAIRVNEVSGTVAPTTGFPVSQDGTYSLTVSALATDRQGNPVLPGTSIRFGAIDFPLHGFPQNGSGTFDITGPDGNPKEGGTLFTAPTGHFTTAGGGAGPGDTLLVFGDLVTGNRDLESAATVQSVNTATSLNTVVPFNLNNDTGVSVDSGPVLPYVIGRATEANITASNVTNDLGVASVKLNYPVSRLGKSVYVYAQGDGDQSSGVIKKVTDIGYYVFAGVAPAVLSVSPTSIPGNATVGVQICTNDAVGNPLQGVFIDFAFHDMGIASGKVDGISTSGTVHNPTGADGCTVASVSTLGVGTGGNNTNAPGVNFTALGLAPKNVTIVASGSLILVATPSAFFSTGGVVTLKLVQPDGTPVPNVQLVGTCTGTGGATISLNPQPGITNANGITTATIVAVNLDNYGSAGGGSCTFTTGTGAPTATVQLVGVDFCGIPVSPPDSRCAAAP